MELTSLKPSNFKFFLTKSVSVKIDNCFLVVFGFPRLSVSGSLTSTGLGLGTAGNSSIQVSKNADSLAFLLFSSWVATEIRKFQRKFTNRAEISCYYFLFFNILKWPHETVRYL